MWEPWLEVWEIFAKSDMENLWQNYVGTIWSVDLIWEECIVSYVINEINSKKCVCRIGGRLSDRAIDEGVENLTL